MRYGVPLMVVVEPTRPEGAKESGISVELGTITNGEPLTRVVWKGLVGDAAGKGRVVPAGMTKNGVLFIVSVEPMTPEGARESGIVVGPSMTTKLLPPISVVGKASGAASVVGLGTTR
jgi:hypothetical protein